MNKIDTTATGNVLVEMTPKEWHRASILFKASEDVTIDLGEEILRYRRQTGTSLADTAKQLGISSNYVSLIEWGLANNVTPQLRQRILNLAGSR